MDELPAALRVPSPFPFVGRSARAGEAAPAATGGRGRGAPGGPPRGSAGSGKSRLVREFAARGRRGGGAGAVRRLRRGRALPIRTVRRRRSSASCAGSTRRAASGARPVTAASSRGCCRAWTSCWASCRRRSRADPDTERHRLHTAVTDLLGLGQPAAPGRAGDRGRPLGGRADAAAPASPGPGAWAEARAAVRHLPRHRGGGTRGALADARRPAPRRRRRAAQPGRASQTEEIGEFVSARVAVAPAPTCPSRPVDLRPHRRQCVPGVRAVAGADGDEGDRGGRRASCGWPARWPTSGPPRACARSSDGRLAEARADDHRAARARRHRRRRSSTSRSSREARGSASASSSRRSTRRSGAA